MRILIVEDEPTLGKQLKSTLEATGYAVDLSVDGEDGHFMGSTEEYDAVILDLGLPEIDGLTVLGMWRREGRKFPVLVLTARDSWSDKVAGLDAGADDYLGKPFELDELAARLRALVRRGGGRAEAQMEWNGLRLDPARMRGTRDGRDIGFSPREFTILQALMERPGAILGKPQLEERIYGWQEEVESNTIEVHVHNLRAKLGAGFIQTVRGAGYRLAAAPA